MRIEYDYRKLRGRVIEKFGSLSAFAEVLGVTTNTISKKFTGKLPITARNIEEWSSPELLDISPQEYYIFYFRRKSE